MHFAQSSEKALLFQTSAGKAGEMIDRGDNTYGGKFVVNPSGGLISKGHPLGATGMFNWLKILFWGLLFSFLRYPVENSSSGGR